MEAVVVDITNALKSSCRMERRSGATGGDCTALTKCTAYQMSKRRAVTDVEEGEGSPRAERAVTTQDDIGPPNPFRALYSARKRADNGMDLAECVEWEQRLWRREHATRILFSRRRTRLWSFVRTASTSSSKSNVSDSAIGKDTAVAGTAITANPMIHINIVVRVWDN